MPRPRCYCRVFTRSRALPKNPCRAFYDARCVRLMISPPFPSPRARSAVGGFIVGREPRNAALPNIIRRIFDFSFLVSRRSFVLLPTRSTRAFPDGKIGLYETPYRVCESSRSTLLFEKRRFNNGVILSLSLSLSLKEREDFARNPYEFENN